MPIIVLKVLSALRVALIRYWKPLLVVALVVYVYNLGYNSGEDNVRAEMWAALDRAKIDARAAELAAYERGVNAATLVTNFKLGAQALKERARNAENADDVCLDDGFLDGLRDLQGAATGPGSPEAADGVSEEE